MNLDLVREATAKLSGVLELAEKFALDTIKLMKALADDGALEEREEVEAEGAEEIEAALGLMLLAVLGGSFDDVEVAVGRVYEHIGTLREASEEMLAKGALLGVQTARMQLGARIEVDWDGLNDQALAWARTYSYELVKGLDDTTRDILRREIAAWIESGEPLDVLSKRLAEHFGEVRARLIAATEVTRAFAQGNRAAWRGGSVGSWRWETTADERVCSICGGKAGQVFGLDDQFPPAHPGCRCWGVPVLTGGADG